MKKEKKIKSHQEICVVHIVIDAYYIIFPTPTTIYISSSSGNDIGLFLLCTEFFCAHSYKSLYFSQTCHPLNALFICSLSVILYFAKLQSYQSKFYCINIFFHKANRTQCAFFLISGHYCKNVCARTNLIICMLQ